MMETKVRIMEKLTSSTWVPVGLAVTVVVAAMTGTAALMNDRNTALGSIVTIQEWVKEQKAFNESVTKTLQSLSNDTLVRVSLVEAATRDQKDMIQRMSSSVNDLNKSVARIEIMLQKEVSK